MTTMTIIVAIFLNLFSLYLLQATACTVIHVLNKTERYPETLREALSKQLNIFWVLYNLKKIRA